MINSANFSNNDSLPPFAEKKPVSRAVFILAIISVILILLAVAIILIGQNPASQTPATNLVSPITDAQKQQSIDALNQAAQNAPPITDAQKQQSIDALNQAAQNAPPITDAQKQQSIDALNNQ